MAISSAIDPGASPGARMALPFGQIEHGEPRRRDAVAGIAQARRSDRRLRFASRQIAGPALMADRGDLAVSRRADPDALNRCGRCGVLLNMKGRGSATFTGRAARAPSAASSASARTKSLPPKPPPTYGEIMRTFSLGSPSVVARSVAFQSIIWFDVHTVSMSPFQAAIDACGSIIACA